MAENAAKPVDETPSEPNWDKEGQSVIERFSVPGKRGRKNTYEVLNESTEKGEFPPRFRLIVRCVEGDYKGQETTVEKQADGEVLISNELLFSKLGQLVQDTITGFATVGRNAMARGWNSGQQHGFVKGHAAGVTTEKDRAAGVRQAQGAASRAAYDAVQAEAAETGRDPYDVRHDHVTRLVQERGLPKGRAAGSGRGE